MAGTIPGDWSAAGAGRDRRAAGRRRPSDPALIERALAVAETIPDYQERSQALAEIAVRLAVVDPARALH